MMTHEDALNSARCFAFDETRDMRDAYELASDAFRMTHPTNADLETKLASIILFIYAIEKIANPGHRVDLRMLAEESLDTLVRFTDAEMRPLGSAA